MSSVIREKLEDYFASMNPTSRRMMADIRSSRQEYSSDWDKLHPEKQSDILWKAIVKPEALKKYEKIPVEPLNVEYFPVLRVRPGEKIIVEEDNVSTRSFGNSWRDEHSAPFRWETASQLGLDIEDETDTQKSSAQNESIEIVKEKDAISVKSDGKKEEEIKRPVTVKRPEVPPPPVPPHAVPPVPPHIEPPVAPSPPPEKNDTPIYAKVVKRKSSSKTLVISEMKAHRKAKEEMKPAVPPRMSLELKGSVDVTKFKTMPIDIDDIPKTGFDFLDNW